MNNSLYIGGFVYNKLTNIEQTGTRCYPLIAENSTNFPFIIYKRDSLERDSLTKDGYGDDNVTVTVTVVAESYKESIDIAQQVRQLLTVNSYNYNMMKITSKLTSAYEYFEDNSYIQSLTFSMSVS